MVVFWLITITCALVILQVAFYNRLGLKNVDYKRYFVKKRIFAGDTVQLVEVVENNKLLPLPWLRVESAVSPWLHFGELDNLDITGDKFLKSVFFMGSYKRITRRHNVVAERRGYYDCSQAFVTTGDLVGLGSVSKECRNRAALLVYPRIADPEELPDEALRWQGEVSVRRWTDPDPLLTTGVREYRPGDSRRDVNWRATARMDDLYVNQRDYTVEPRLLIILNTQIRADLWGKMEDTDAEVIELGISLAAQLAYWGSANGMLPGLRANSGSLMPGSEKELASIEPGSAGLEDVLEALAVLKVEMRVNFLSLLDSEITRRTNGMDILCLSAYWDEELADRAAELERLGNHVKYIPIGGAEK